MKANLDLVKGPANLLFMVKVSAISARQAQAPLPADFIHPSNISRFMQ